MNISNNYTASQKYNHISTDVEKFDGKMGIEAFKKIQQENPKYSIDKISYTWGNALKEAVVSSNIDLIKHIVKQCGKQIFDYHGLSGLTPLCYAQNPEITQLLIDLGADVNINFHKLNGTISPLQSALIYSKTNRDKREITKCLLKNQANSEKFFFKYKDIIEELQSEIKFEKELASKAAYFKLALSENPDLVNIQIPSELVNVIFQKIIDSSYPNIELNNKTSN